MARRNRDLKQIRRRCERKRKERKRESSVCVCVCVCVLKVMSETDLESFLVNKEHVNKDQEMKPA